MASAKYYVIQTSENGPSFECIDGGELEERLANGYYGEGEHAPKWGTETWDLEARTGAIIIRGEPVVPKAVDVVKKWSIG